jgi:hypothetical protein
MARRRAPVNNLASPRSMTMVFGEDFGCRRVVAAAVVTVGVVLLDTS